MHATIATSYKHIQAQITPRSPRNAKNCAEYHGNIPFVSPGFTLKAKSPAQQRKSL
jgi:hypothetical protein